jgi:hypothetical protein
MLETHEMVTRCGDHLDAPDERRYTDTLAAVRKFIVDNARLSEHPDINAQKGLLKYETRIRARYRAINAKSCALIVGPSAKKPYANILRDMASEESTKKILGDLKTPKDPFFGECR